MYLQSDTVSQAPLALIFTPLLLKRVHDDAGVSGVQCHKGASRTLPTPVAAGVTNQSETVRERAVCASLSNLLHQPFVFSRSLRARVVPPFPSSYFLF